MAIKNLTDQHKTDGPIAGGRQIRLGTLHKGTRVLDANGKVQSMTDHDYFVFTPATQEAAAAYTQAFIRAYGERPRRIGDVRISASLAGNFNIEDQAWLTAARHNKAGSLFLARSDGDQIYQARDSDTGNMVIYGEGDRPDFDLVSVLDNKDRPCYPYQGKLYPWQNNMMIDLVLPDLNRELLAAGLAYGTVTFITHAANDIPVIIANYNGILHDLASLYADPTDAAAVARQISYIPLRDIPMTLERYKKQHSTPGYGDAGAGDRRFKDSWLVRLSLNAEFAASVEEARKKRTAVLMSLIADGGQLGLGAGRSPQGGRTNAELDQLSADLFDNEIPAPKRATATAWDNIEDPVWEDPDPDWAADDSDPAPAPAPAPAPGAAPAPAPAPGAAPAPAPAPGAAVDMKDKDALAAAVFEWDQGHGRAFANVGQVKALHDQIGGSAFNMATRDLMWEALTGWAVAVTDHALDSKDAAAAARGSYRAARDKRIQEAA